MQVPHVQEVDLNFGIIPAATQSNDFGTSCGAGFKETTGSDATFLSFPSPGRGESQTLHLSVAVAGFCSMQVKQYQLPFPGVGAGFGSAGTKSKDLAGSEDPFVRFLVDCAEPLMYDSFGLPTLSVFSAPGLGESQTLHFSTAVGGFCSKHTEHVH